MRIEIGTALKRGIPVIPILLEDTRIPKADQLPDDLKELPLRNALNVRHVSFPDDLERLIRWLKREARRKAEEQRPAAEEAEAQETREWGLVISSRDKVAEEKVIQNFLERWPHSRHAEAARTRIAALARIAALERLEREAVEAEARRKAEEERAAAEQAEARRKAEEQRTAAEEAEARRKAEEQRAAAEQAEARRKAEEQRAAAEQAEARRKAEAQRAAAEQAAAKRKAEAEAQRKAAAEAAAKRKAEEQRPAAEEAWRKARRGRAWKLFETSPPGARPSDLRFRPSPHRVWLRACARDHDGLGRRGRCNRRCCVGVDGLDGLFIAGCP